MACLLPVRGVANSEDTLFVIFAAQVVYEKNARREKAEEGQAELETLRKRNTQARRKALEAGDA